MNRVTLCLIDSDCAQNRDSEASDFSSLKRKIYRLEAKVNLWYERSKQRRQLLTLADNPDLLKDLGLSNYDLKHEGRKPFWRK